jgi:hypothetical protein
MITKGAYSIPQLVLSGVVVTGVIYAGISTFVGSDSAAPATSSSQIWQPPPGTPAKPGSLMASPAPISYGSESSIEVFEKANVTASKKDRDAEPAKESLKPTLEARTQSGGVYNAAAGGQAGRPAAAPGQESLADGGSGAGGGSHTNSSSGANDASEPAGNKIIPQAGSLNGGKVVYSRSKLGVGTKAAGFNSKSAAFASPGQQGGSRFSDTREASAFGSGSGSGSRETGAGSGAGLGGGGQAAQPSGGSMSSPSGAAGGGGGGGTSGSTGAEEIPTAADGPAAFVWPNSFHFGNLSPDESAVRLVTITNIGNKKLKVGKIVKMEKDVPFFKEADKCTAAVLAPGKKCSFRLRFSPKKNGEFGSGFEIKSNDGDAINYQKYVEVRGEAKKHKLDLRGAALGPGGINRLDFGTVPQGQALTIPLHVANLGGAKWDNIKLKREGLPASLTLVKDGCSGKDIPARGHCIVTVKFAPTEATNKKFASKDYGKYSAVDARTQARSVVGRPRFPLVIEEPVMVKLEGLLTVLVNYKAKTKTGTLVLEMPIKAESCAPYPEKGLVRIQHYYFYQ